MNQKETKTAVFLMTSLKEHVLYDNPSNIFARGRLLEARHVAEYSPPKPGNIRGYPPIFKTACFEKYTKDHKHNSLHSAQSYARIFVAGHYLLLQAHWFPRA